MKTEINVTKIIIVEEEYSEKIDYLKLCNWLSETLICVTDLCSEREVDLKK